MSIDLTLEETKTWFFRFGEFPNHMYHYIHIDDIITEGNKVVVRFQRIHFSYGYNPSPYPISVYHLSSEIWTWRIVNDKIVEGWSVSDDTPQEENNKALVKEAILAFDEDPFDANLPDLFDPNYVQYGPYSFSTKAPLPHFSGINIDGVLFPEPVIFDSIIAEGDIVSVRLSYEEHNRFAFVELASYRIYQGKIVEGWLATYVRRIRD